MEQVNEKIARLKEIVEESERMVFLVGQGFLQRVESRIFEV